MKTGRALRLTVQEFKQLLADRPDAQILSEVSSGINFELLDPPTRENKLGAKKVEYNEYRFDSKLEYRRYLQLQEWEQLGLITGLDCEHKRIGKRDKEAVKRHRWVLQPAYVKQGKRVRAVTYTDDFQYTIVETGELIVEDIKGGFVTPSFKRSAKMFSYVYPNVHFFVNYKINGWYGGNDETIGHSHNRDHRS